MEIPVIDLGLTNGTETLGEIPGDAVEQIASAAARFGFFAVVNHGISPAQIDAVWTETHRFFAQSRTDRRALSRSRTTSRGYYDRELTKNRRDRKEVFDYAHVPRRDLPEEHPDNRLAVDGNNRWPTDLPGFRDTMVGWIEACEQLSFVLLDAFADALGSERSMLRESFGPDHTSFARLNHYPLHDPLDEDEAVAVTALGDMALHHHSDAGALTVLLQDAVGGLQVEHDGRWIDVPPADNSLVINTGDMMQVWSNDRFPAALHRVAPRTVAERYSIPYFFNPSYASDYAPLPSTGTARYRTINWGDFRQARADGDFADYGTEIQISQFRL